MDEFHSIAEAFQSGRTDADATLRALDLLLLRVPDHGDALTLAGFCRLRQGDPEAALPLLDRALALPLNPARWLAQVNRAEARRLQGDLPGAIADYRAAAGLNPQPEFFVNLASLLSETGRAGEARVALEKALSLDPASAAAWNNLGLLLETEGDTEAALAAFERAFDAAPRSGDIAQNLERLLFGKGKRLAAESAEAAESFYAGATARHPEMAGLFLGWGNARLDRCEVARAKAAFGAALQLQPDAPDALVNYAVALHRLGKPEEALALYEKAARIQGTPSPELRWNRALSLLILGRLREGFEDYEARATAWTLHRPYLDLDGRAPRWDGRPFPGQTLLLHAEQGFGDAIQFIRYAALAKALSPSGTVVAACSPPLERLFKGIPGVDRVVPLSGLPARFDWHLPLLSLPRVFGTTHETIPAPIPPGPEKPPKRASGDPLRIALVWSGNPKYGNDRNRSCPLELFDSLGALPGTGWTSLQCGEAASRVGNRSWLRDGSGGLVDFYETACRMREADLVISVDTAAAHLAGTLGLPVWVLLPFAPDWRWLLGRSDSPWYPTARLFRQPSPDDWPGAVAAVGAALRERLAR